jgi:hypothetical protein
MGKNDATPLSGYLQERANQLFLFFNRLIFISLNPIVQSLDLLIVQYPCVDLQGSLSCRVISVSQTGDRVDGKGYDNGIEDKGYKTMHQHQAAYGAGGYLHV